MRTLEQLTEEENNLIQVIDNVKGTIDEKYDLLDEMGVFDKYKNIHLQYASLSDSNLEALKRAVFLIWYSRLEPEFLTGINELDNNSISKTMRLLDDYLKNSPIDVELEWMLNYYSSWGYLFDDYNYLHAIKEVLLKEPTESKLPKTINRDEMMLRGSMGRYWNSLNMYNQ